MKFGLQEHGITGTTAISGSNSRKSFVANRDVNVARHVIQ
jgi:hypothetical protein